MRIVRRLSIALVLITVLTATNLFGTKLVTFTFRGETRLGAWIDEGVIDLNRAYLALLESQEKTRARARADALVPATMLEFLQGEADSLQAGMEAIQFIRGSIRERGVSQKLRDKGLLFTHEEVKLNAPLPDPPHVLSMGLNYKKHAEETGSAIPDYPIIFTKEGSIIGPGEAIRVPKVVEEPDYEAELVFVIGKRAYQVSEEDALQYVAGYATFNDVSARDLQSRVSQWTLGKSVDTFAAMGPYLVLRDEVPDPQALRISTRIGNEMLQDSNTSDMIFSVAQVISYVSQVMALTPGTVVTTGTPPGVGSARKPPRYLQHGDTVVVEVEKLGSLANPVIRE